MNKDIIDTNEKDFIKVCFNIVAGLEVKNESQAIAKEAILDEVEYLQNNWNELKEWLKKEHREDAIVINLTWKHATGKILNRINELEGKSE